MVNANAYLEHDNLVTELKTLEDFNPQERLDHARKRRKEQLEAYNLKRVTHSEKLTQASHDKNIHFQSSITLIEASARNDADEVEKLVTIHNMSPDEQNEDGLSALHQAVIEDCADVVGVLVEHGADLNIKDADLWTPLHAAVACGNYDLASYLIENGASLIEINTDGNMPIDLIEDNEDIEILLDDTMAHAGYTEDTLEEIRSVIPNQMLEDLENSYAENRNLNIAGDHGETACHIACANGYVEVLEFLLEHSARFDIGDKDDWQPIHAAACWGHDKIIEILVGSGADLDAKTKDGETPYDLTEDEDMQEMLIELKESGNSRNPKVKRSQSNSSRTLSVRRSSIIEKRQTSLSDAKQEGIVRAHPIPVDIKTEDLDSDGIECTESENDNNVFPSDENCIDVPKEIHNGEEKESFIENQTGEQKEDMLDIDSSNSDNILDTPKTNDDCVVDINLVEEKVVYEEKNSETKPEPTKCEEPSSNNLTISNANHISTEKTKDPNNVEIEIAEHVPSHNTAAKNENNHKFNDSNEAALKKKCCVIL